MTALYSSFCGVESLSFLRIKNPPMFLIKQLNKQKNLTHGLHYYIIPKFEKFAYLSNGISFKLSKNKNEIFLYAYIQNV
jgi:hypothetical protein